MKNTSWYPNPKEAENITIFILWFSRYEFALKNGNYQVIGKDNLEPDWGRFIADLNTQEVPIPNSLENELAYLKNNPPKKQLSDKSWKAIQRNSDWEWIIRSLTTVRNNLFHGGKHFDGQILDPARDQVLIDICLKIMKELILFCPQEIQDFLS